MGQPGRRPPAPSFYHYAFASESFVPVLISTTLLLTLTILAWLYLQSGVKVLGALSRSIGPDLEVTVDALRDRARELRLELAPQEIQDQLPYEFHATRIRRRLLAELEALSRRGNLNLIIGILTTFIGISLLAYFVILPPEWLVKTTDPLKYLAQFIPRLSLVILIEVFAYFFLKLYKTSIFDIKYYQNELTNIEARTLALRAASDAGNETTLTVVITRLAETDRNFLRKDETTADVETTKAQSNAMAESLKQLVILVKTVSGGATKEKD